MGQYFTCSLCPKHIPPYLGKQNVAMEWLEKCFISFPKVTNEIFWYVLIFHIRLKGYGTFLPPLQVVFSISTKLLRNFHPNFFEVPGTLEDMLRIPQDQFEMKIYQSFFVLNTIHKVMGQYFTCSLCPKHIPPFSPLFRKIKCCNGTA